MRSIKRMPKIVGAFRLLSVKRLSAANYISIGGSFSHASTTDSLDRYQGQTALLYAASAAACPSHGYLRYGTPPLSIIKLKLAT